MADRAIVEYSGPPLESPDCRGAEGSPLRLARLGCPAGCLLRAPGATGALFARVAILTSRRAGLLLISTRLPAAAPLRARRSLTLTGPRRSFRRAAGSPATHRRARHALELSCLRDEFAGLCLQSVRHLEKFTRGGAARCWPATLSRGGGAGPRSILTRPILSRPILAWRSFPGSLVARSIVSAPGFTTGAAAALLCHIVSLLNATARRSSTRGHLIIEIPTVQVVPAPSREDRSRHARSIPLHESFRTCSAPRERSPPATRAKTRRRRLVRRRRTPVAEPTPQHVYFLRTRCFHPAFHPAAGDHDEARAPRMFA
jgi:hypothetical protein